MHGVPGYLAIGLWLVGFFLEDRSALLLLWWLHEPDCFAARAGIVERLGEMDHWSEGQRVSGNRRRIQLFGLRQTVGGKPPVSPVYCHGSISEPWKMSVSE
jgi:hypothetical protein